VVALSPLASDPIRGEALFYWAKAALENKDFETAQEQFARVITLSQNEQAAEARYRVAWIAYLQGNLDEAVKRCHEANEGNASYPYWIAKSLILLSDISVDKKDLFNAKAPLEAVIENFQGDENILREAQEKLDKILALEKQQSRILQDTTKGLQFQYHDDGKNED
jgi:tetratricopeptide (TPR) repeat protein